MSTRRHKCPEPEEYENPDRYLGSYADMITILLVLFIVLFAFGQIDLAKFEKFKQGFGRSGATPPAEQALLEGGETVFDTSVITEIVVDPLQGDAPTSIISPNLQGGAGRGPQENSGGQQREALEQAQRELAAAIAAIDLDVDVRFRIESRGLVITIITDKVLFDSGSASLTPDGRTVIGTIAETLGPLPNRLSIEGHTDDRPIATGRFPDNWELSVARAASVLRALVDDHQFDPLRMSAAGYGETRPVATNETPVGRQANRRVEIVVHNLEPEPTPDFGEGA